VATHSLVASTGGTPRRTRPPPPAKIVAEHRQGSLTPGRRAHRTTARFTLPPMSKGPLRRKLPHSQRPRSPPSASDRDRRAPPPALRNPNARGDLGSRWREEKEKWEEKTSRVCLLRIDNRRRQTHVGNGPGFRCETVRVQVGFGR
jgi:hypothetical protein